MLDIKLLSDHLENVFTIHEQVWGDNCYTDTHRRPDFVVCSSLSALALYALLNKTRLDLTAILGPKAKRFLEAKKLKFGIKSISRSMITSAGSYTSRRSTSSQKGSKVMDPIVFRDWSLDFDFFDNKSLFQEVTNSLYARGSEICYKYIRSYVSAYSNKDASMRLFLLMCERPELFSHSETFHQNNTRKVLLVKFADTAEAIKSCPEFGKSASMSDAFKKATKKKIETMVDRIVDRAYAPHGYISPEVLQLLPAEMQEYIHTASSISVTPVSFRGLPGVCKESFSDVDLSIALSQMEELKAQIVAAQTALEKVSSFREQARNSPSSDWLDIRNIILEKTKDVETMLLWSMSGGVIKEIAELALELQED